MSASAPLSARAAGPTTERESVNSASNEGNGSSYDPSVSANGRWVVFWSTAANLVTPDANSNGDVFLRDRATGQTTRIDQTADGTQADGDGAFYPKISADGRYVTFIANATNLVAGVSNYHVFRYDRTARAMIAIPLPTGYSLNTDSDSIPAMSADGSRVVFSAEGGHEDVYWWGASTPTTVQRVTQLNDGTPANGGAFGGYNPAISGDGRWVGFTTDATNLLPAGQDINGYRDIYVRNLDTGAFTRVSVGSGSPGAEANLHSSTPAIDYDGCVVAFHSSATNLVAGDAGGTNHNYARDRCAATTEDVGADNSGTPGDAFAPIAISDDGCRLVFPATAIASPPPTGSNKALVERDRCAGTTTRLDVSSTNDPGNAGPSSTQLAISGGSGRYVAFSSSASNLVGAGADGNGTFDVFLRDLATNTPPVAALTVTRDGQTVTADAGGASDPDGFLITGSINWGDGSAAQTGLHATHTYAHSGTYGVTSTVTDADGASAAQTVAVTIPDIAAPPTPNPSPKPKPKPKPKKPTLDRLKLTKTTFAVVAKGKTPDGKHGTTLKLRLNVAGTLTLTFERVRKGRKAKGHCRTTAKTGKRCTLYKRAGSLSKKLASGSRSVVLTGRLGTKALPAGRYRLTLVAKTSAALKSSSHRLTFTIVHLKPKKRKKT